MSRLLALTKRELTSYFFESPLKGVRIREIRRRAHLLGLDITGGAMGNDFGHAPDSDTTARQMKYFREWVDVFERMHLMLRLSPHLRERHGD